MVHQLEGWWTYEYCRGRWVQQFHQEGDERVAAFTLGLAPPEDPDVRHRPLRSLLWPRKAIEREDGNQVIVVLVVSACRRSRHAVGLRRRKALARSTANCTPTGPSATLRASPGAFHTHTHTHRARTHNTSRDTHSTTSTHRTVQLDFYCSPETRTGMLVSLKVPLRPHPLMRFNRAGFCADHGAVLVVGRRSPPRATTC
jgi:hypothetical protein